MSGSRPYEGYRVLEIGSGASSWCGRLLADMGADVVKVEPPEGDPMRTQRPLRGGVGISYLYYNANKRGTTLDLNDPADQALVRERLGDFDVLIDGNAPGWLAARGLDPCSLREQQPSLIVTSVTHFGQTGPYRDWEGSAAVDMALSSHLLRCGLAEGAPVTAPYQVPYIVAGVGAASVTAAAILERNRTGEGDWIDCAIVEALATCFDWSTAGAAASGGTGGVRRAGSGPLYRPFKTADGWLRLINLSARQANAFIEWLGNPPEMAGPEWKNPMYVGQNRAVAEVVFARVFGGRKKHDVYLDGQSRGIGAVPINSPEDALADPHFRERKVFVTFELPGGATVPCPGGVVRMDDSLPTPPRPAPQLMRNPAVLAGRRTPLAPTGKGGFPLAGVRVVEIGSGAVAPEGARQTAQFGADVIKIESFQQVDFMRGLSLAGLESSPAWASSSRNKRSVQIDLKHPEGLKIARALADTADIFFENSTGGVMDRLGLGYADLAATNKRLVYVSSQAMGAWGPYTSFGGFGPTNQAASGAAYLWNDPEAPIPEGVNLSFPDHTIGRLASFVAMAALDEARRTGKGQHIDLGQAEAAMAIIGEAFIETGILGESAPQRGNRNPIGAPWGVFPTLGDDEWIAVSVENDAQWQALKSEVREEMWDEPALDTVEGRLEQRDLIEAQLGAFTALQQSGMLMRRLQKAGVPAGALYNPIMLLADVHFHEREWAHTVDHAVLGWLRMEGNPFKTQRMAIKPSVMAPRFGEHTDEVLREWIGLTEEQIGAAREANALR